MSRSCSNPTGALLVHTVHHGGQREHARATFWIRETTVRPRNFYDKASTIGDATTQTEDLSRAPLHRVGYRNTS